MKPEKIIYTIGHSTHSLDEFIAILKHYNIKILVDVRSIPRSRYVPQFNSEAFSKKLQAHDITYLHMKGLGGLRHSKKDSINLGWRNKAFRGFADYMQTDEFVENLEHLINQASQAPTAIMCAEAVPWRCHRSLIADSLLVRKFKVLDILSIKKIQPHTLTPWAKVQGKTIIYPSE